MTMQKTTLIMAKGMIWTIWVEVEVEKVEVRYLIARVLFLELIFIQETTINCRCNLFPLYPTFFQSIYVDQIRSHSSPSIVRPIGHVGEQRACP